MPGYVPSSEETTISWTTSNPHLAKSAPVRAVATVTVDGFGPRPDGAGWTFNRGLVFTTPAAAPDADMLAVASGVLTFVPAAGTEPDTLQLQLSGLDTAGMQAAGMPSWVAPPAAFAYAGVDKAEVRAAIQQIFGDAARLAQANKTYTRITGNAALGAAALAQVFTDHPEQLGDGVPCTNGEVLGKGATSGTDRRFELRVVEPGISTAMSRNPAYYLNAWQHTGIIDLTNHPLDVPLRRIDAGLEANGVTRFVSTTGDNANTPFTDPALPGKTLHAVIAACDPADTVLILDAGTYREAEHLITVPVNITSAAILDTDQRHLGGDADDATVPTVPAGYPILQGPENYGTISATNFTDTGTIPTANAHRVIKFTVPAGAGVASLTKVIVRYGGAREGAGIYCYRSAGVMIASCHVHRNVAFFNALPRTAGALLPNPFPGPGWFEEGSGGGIGLYRSDAIIWGNLIERNLALYGAAIGIFASCYPLIAENHIRTNHGPDWFVGATVSDGGAIRVLQQSLRYDSQAGLQAAVPAGSVTSPKLIPLTQMYDPAEVAVTQRSWIHLRHNRLEGNIAEDDGGGVYATALTRLFSVGNNVIGNEAHDGDGGGYRISTASVMRSINDVVKANKVLGPASKSATGGGIASRCSSLYLLGTVVDGNTTHFAGAGVSYTATREGEVSDGGTARVLGYSIPSWDDQRRLALGFTQGELMIEATTIVRNNVADDTAHGKGGGLYVFRFQDGSTFTADGVTVEIEVPATVLDPSNDAAFTQAGAKPDRRLYLVDQTKPGSGGAPPLILADADLAAAPPYLSHVSV